MTSSLSHLKAELVARVGKGSFESCSGCLCRPLVVTWNFRRGQQHDERFSGCANQNRSGHESVPGYLAETGFVSQQ